MTKMIVEDLNLSRSDAPSIETLENDRLRTLREYQLLDTEPEIAFDRITKLAADLFDVPVALVSLSDESRQWFKSAYGLQVAQIDRENSFCQNALLGNEPLMIPDARADDRFRENPLVTGEPFIRFYAGVPLRAYNGHILGTLCILDTRPRPALIASNLERLGDLADVIMAEAELRRTSVERDQAKTLLEQALSFTNMVAWKLDTRSGEIEWQGAFAEVWGVDSADPLDTGAAALSRVHPDDVTGMQTEIRKAVSEKRHYEGEFRIVHPKKGVRWLAGRGDTKSGNQSHVLIGINFDITETKNREAQMAMLMRELHHRMRNLFATVGAIISLTRHSATDIDDYAERIGNRLDALGRAQNVLLGANFLTGSMHALLREVQSAFPRISWSGPDLKLPENAVVALALLFNELATNAAKHGALTNGNGRVTVNWEQDGGNGEGRQFRLVWIERGGQPVSAPPESSSFGTLLMDRSVTNNLGGIIERDWKPEGLECTVTLPARWEVEV